MNGVVKNISALSIQTTGQMPALSKGQKALLTTIRNCIESKQSLTFDLIVRVYYSSVRKTFWKHFNYKPKYEGKESWGDPWEYKSHSEHDILECWEKQIDLWFFKAQIRQWFVSNIGILVIKNQLVIIPTIDLGEEESNG